MLYIQLIFQVRTLLKNLWKSSNKVKQMLKTNTTIMFVIWKNKCVMLLMIIELKWNQEMIHWIKSNVHMSYLQAKLLKLINKSVLLPLKLFLILVLLLIHHNTRLLESLRLLIKLLKSATVIWRLICTTTLFLLVDQLWWKVLQTDLTVKLEIWQNKMQRQTLM